MDLFNFLNKSKNSYKMNENITKIMEYDSYDIINMNLFFEKIYDCYKSLKPNESCIIFHNFDKNKFNDLKNELGDSFTERYIIVIDDFYSFCLFYKCCVHIIFTFNNYKDFTNFLDTVIQYIVQYQLNKYDGFGNFKSRLCKLNNIIKIDNNSLVKLKDYNWNNLYVKVRDFYKKECERNILNNIHNLVMSDVKDNSSINKLQNSHILGLRVHTSFNDNLSTIISSCKYLSELEIIFKKYGYCDLEPEIDKSFFSKLCKCSSLTSLSLQCYRFNMELSYILSTAFSNNALTNLDMYVLKSLNYLNNYRRSRNETTDIELELNIDCIKILNNLKNIVIIMDHGILTSITYDNLVKLCECVKTNEITVKFNFRIVFSKNTLIEKRREMILSLYDTYKYNQYSYLIAVKWLQEYVNSHKELDIKLNDVRSTYIMSQTLVDLCK